MWGFGSLAGLCLVVQIVSGVFLGMHYSCNVLVSMESILHIMRDVVNGWLIRYIHSNGASMFFVLVYIHILRGLYYGTFVVGKERLWVSGVVILVLMMGTAFMGYVLPWGQMSLWGATVITKLLTAILLVGEEILGWIWGGYCVGNATLNRMYSIHYVLLFIIVGMVLVHLSLLHSKLGSKGSSNLLGISVSGGIIFYLYCYIKDIYGLLYMLGGLCVLVFFYLNSLGHSDNWMFANILVTLKHIVLEWYFLVFYGMLRSIESKIGGVICMGLSIVGIGMISLLNIGEKRSSVLRLLFRKTYWVFIVNLVMLGMVGGLLAEGVYIDWCRLSTFVYFSWLFIVLVLLRKGQPLGW